MTGNNSAFVKIWTSPFLLSLTFLVDSWPQKTDFMSQFDLNTFFRQPIIEGDFKMTLPIMCGCCRQYRLLQNRWWELQLDGFKLKNVPHAIAILQKLFISQFQILIISFHMLNISVSMDLWKYAILQKCYCIIKGPLSTWNPHN